MTDIMTFIISSAASMYSSPLSIELSHVEKQEFSKKVGCQHKFLFVLLLVLSVLSILRDSASVHP